MSWLLRSQVVEPEGPADERIVCGHDGAVRRHMGILEIDLGVITLIGLTTDLIIPYLAIVGAAAEKGGLSLGGALADCLDYATDAGIFVFIVADGLRRVGAGRGYLF